MNDQNITPTPQSFGNKIGNWIKSYWPEVAVLIGSIGLALIGIYLSFPKPQGQEPINENLVIILVGVFTFCVFGGNILIWRRNPRINSLKEEIFNLSCDLDEMSDYIESYRSLSYDIINNHLAFLANDVFHLTGNERISVFRYDGNYLITIGRYSKNPDYKSNGRIIYPADQGCIGTALKIGESYTDGLPDPKSKLRDWLRSQKEIFGIPREVAKNFKMKSRCILGIAIEEPKHVDRTAVLLIESIEPLGLDKGSIKTCLANGEQKRLSDLISVLEKVLPDPSVATERGF